MLEIEGKTLKILQLNIRYILQLKNSIKVQILRL